MKAYADDLEYQGLVTAYEIAKSAVQEAKNQKKEVKAFFKTTKKESESKAPVYAAHLKYKQAKLAQKFEALTARAAELDIHEFVHAFNQKQKATAKVVKEEEAPKVKTAKKAKKIADTVDKPASKEGQAKSTTKVSKKATQQEEVAKSAKAETQKETPKAVVEAKAKAKTETKKETKKAAVEAKAKAKADEKVRDKASKTAKSTKKSATKPVAESDSVATGVQEAAKKPVAQKDGVSLKKTSVNDLTAIEGIGAKIAQILAENKVKNFKALIATPVEDIKAWLKDNKLQFVDPTTWAEQAELLDAGKMLKFEALKKELKGGKRS